MQSITDQLTEYLDADNPGGMLGLYLTGSTVMAGLRANSDIDLVLVTERSLNPAERQGLLTLLMKISGEPARPVEFTSVVISDIVPWSYPPVCDFLYGEWLRSEFERGVIPHRHPSPDLAVILTALLQYFQVLRGPAVGDLIAPVPQTDLRRAIVDSLPDLLADLIGDERNVILTLARMLFTIETGEIVSKDEAARRIAADLSEPDRFVVNLAAAGYLGQIQDDWSVQRQQVEAAAGSLAAKIRETAATG